MSSYVLIKRFLVNIFRLLKKCIKKVYLQFLNKNTLELKFFFLTEIKKNPPCVKEKVVSHKKCPKDKFFVVFSFFTAL